ncbi:MAG: hypothetical protein L3J96_00725 [Thermoplasmata archaeon]|nr:hypothetical protein [Thermoplasmata archaeon]
MGRRTGSADGGSNGPKIGDGNAPKIGTVGEVEGAAPPQRFRPRREATGDEIATAVRRLEEIREGVAAGRTLGETSKILHLPVTALERALAAPPSIKEPVSVDELSVPTRPSVDRSPSTATAAVRLGIEEAAPSSTSPARRADRQAPAPPTAEQFQDTYQKDEDRCADEDPYAAPRPQRRVNPLDVSGGLGEEPALHVYRMMVQAGISEPRARLVGRSFRSQRANDYDALASIMARAGVPGQVASLLISSYRDEVGDPVPLSGADGEVPAPGGSADNARLRRQLAEAREARFLDAQIRALEREAGPPPPSGPSPELAAIRTELEVLRGRNAALETELQEKRLLDSINAGFNARIGPLAEKIALLESRSPDRMTLEDATVQGRLAEITAESSSRKALTDLLTEKVRNPGPARRLGDRVADSSLVDVLTDQARKIVQSSSPPETSQAPDQASLEMEAREAEARLAAMSSDRGGSGTVPSSSPSPSRLLSIPEDRGGGLETR